MITRLAPSFSQLPNNPNYILSQYNLVGEGSKVATEKNEVMLVLNPEDELSDLLLARFGFYTQEEFLEIVYKATEDSYNEDVYKNNFTYEELLGKTFTWYPNDTVFSKQPREVAPGFSVDVMSHNYKSDGLSKDGSLELKVVGILTPKDTVSFGSVSSGIYYTDQLLTHIIDTNKSCEFFNYIKNIDESNSTTAALMNYYIPYKYTYNYDVNRNGKTDEGEEKTVDGYISPAMSMEDIMGSMMGGSDKNTAFDHANMKERIRRMRKAC